ncbi:hypothetical protein SANTM175S_06991 [Streptomyces antimycoticus]
MGNAAKSAAYWRRIADSMAVWRSIPAHSRSPNTRASSKRRAVRSSTRWSAFSTPNRSGKMPRK